MTYALVLLTTAGRTLEDLRARDFKKYGKVARCLERLSLDPRHPGLRSHRFHSMTGTNGEPVWESYVENNTPGAWRVFWHYGPDGVTIRIITIVAITPHP